LSLTLPPGRDIELLPRGKTVENAYLRYQSDWNRDGKVVSVRREITVKLPVAVCRDEIRATLAEAIAEIRGDYRSEIALFQNFLGNADVFSDITTKHMPIAHLFRLCIF
jgi:hypothetical protein